MKNNSVEALELELKRIETANLNVKIPIKIGQPGPSSPAPQQTTSKRVLKTLSECKPK